MPPLVINLTPEQIAESRSHVRDGYMTGEGHLCLIELFRDHHTASLVFTRISRKTWLKLRKVLEAAQSEP